MSDLYLHHRVVAAPRRWRSLAAALSGGGAQRLGAAGGALYGVWRSQIGRPRDELTVMTVWPDTRRAVGAEASLLDGVADVVGCESEAMAPTLRPSDADPPRRQGNYAFRWFETPSADWDEFLELCAAAWPGFEAAYDSAVIGLWRCLEGGDETNRSLLLTRRPDLAMWERSKIPRNEAEEIVRRRLSRRYDLCEWTCVYTTTLLSAEDRDDTVRWA